MAETRYFVRFSKEDDCEKVMAFYEHNAHQNVRKRQSDLIKSLVETGAVVLLEDKEGNIAAASVTYPHVVKDAQGVEHAKWQEVGSTRIVINGYSGLFDVMTGLQILRTFVVEPPEEKYVAKMRTEPVQKIAERLGWRPFTPSEELMKSQFQSVEASDQKPPSPEDWYHLTKEGLPITARFVLGVVDNPVLKNRKTEDSIIIDFSRMGFIAMFEPHIRALAAKDMGSIENPSEQQAIKASRDVWMKKSIR